MQTPKSLASRPIISLDDTTLSFLTRWKDNQIEEYAEVEEDHKQLIFSRYYYNRTKQSGFFRLAHFNDKLPYFLKHSPSLLNITVHGLRHTHASLLFESGVIIKDVQVCLRHSDIKTTMDIYTHFTNFAREKAAETFEDFIGF